jgi:hypothetical protein
LDAFVALFEVATQSQLNLEAVMALVEVGTQRLDSAIVHERLYTKSFAGTSTRLCDNCLDGWVEYTGTRLHRQMNNCAELLLCMTIVSAADTAGTV